MTDQRRTMRSIAGSVRRRLSGNAAADAPVDRPRKRNHPLAGFESLVVAGPKRCVVLLASPKQRRELLPWLEEFAADDVHVISPDEAPEWELEHRSASHHSAVTHSQVHFQIKMLGAVDIIVNLLPDKLLPGDTPNQLELFARVFRFLKPRGSFILDRVAISAESSRSLTGWMEVLAAADDPKRLRELNRRDAELARSTGAVLVSRDLVIATKRLRHYVKLRESQVYRVLGSREPGLQMTELEKLSGGEMTSRAVVTSHGVDDLLPDVFTYPDLYLRRYEGKVALAGATLMFAGNTILPDSFRWPHIDNPSNPRLKSVSPNFARIDSEWIPKRTLKGSYYQLDCAYSGHFGHITTEVVSRLWGWDRAKQEIPDLKAVFHLKPGSRKKPSVELALFNAYGIDKSDIVWVNEPVWLESVVSASPMWQNAEPHYVHPGITSTWERLRTGLMATAPDAPTFDRIFVSRGSTLKHRSCRNADEVERVFAAHGFEVVYPERLNLGEQAAIFSRATTVAGFSGSAMFNLMHSTNVETVIVLSHEAYTARNEHLFTSVTGGHVHYYWSAPDVAHPEGDWTTDAFFSDWEFDFERNGESLESLLASLGPTA